MIRFIIRIEDSSHVQVGLNPTTKYKTIDTDIPELETLLKKEDLGQEYEHTRRDYIIVQCTGIEIL